MKLNPNENLVTSQDTSLSSRQLIKKSIKNVGFALCNAFSFSISYMLTKYMAVSNGMSEIMIIHTSILLNMILGVYKVFWSEKKKQPPFTWENYRYAINRAVLSVFYSIFSVLAYQNMNVDTATAIIFLYPMLSSFFAFILLGEKMSTKTVIKMIICIFAVVVVCEPLNPSPDNTFTGYIMSLSTLTVWALMPIASKRTSREVHRCMFLVVNGILWFPIAIFLTFTWEDHSNWSVYNVIVMILGAGAYTAGIEFYELSIRGCRVSIVAQFEYICLALMYLYNIFIFGNEFSIVKLAGCALIMGINMENVIKAIFNI